MPHDGDGIKGMSLVTRITDYITPTLADMGFDLVRVQIQGDQRPTVQIMIEHNDGRTVTIDECTHASRAISAVLDVEDPMDSAYHIEVSSPGIDRPLVRLRDYAKYIGQDAKIEMGFGVDGRRKFRGFIDSVDATAETVTIALPDKPEDEKRVVLPLDDITKAKLVLSDALIKATRPEKSVPESND
jgi:ribosome maturation factor RimP